ncbi:MAG: dipeptidase [Ignavibacteriales bacterium]
MIIDAHADTISRIMQFNLSLRNNDCHFDLIRALSSGVEMQVLSLFTNETEGEPALKNVLSQIEYFEEQLRDCYDIGFLIKSKDDLKFLDSGRIGMMLHLEGGGALGGDINVLGLLQELGVRSLGLTWNHRNMLADGVMETDPKGLTTFGLEVVRELSRLKMVVDLAHLGRPGFIEVLEMINKPPLVSHANAYKVCQHPRNLDDEQLLLLKETKGLICVTFVPKFIKESGVANVGDLIEHMQYIADLIGIDHIGLGSDFDGSEVIIPNVSHYADLIQQMQKSGFTSSDVEKITKGNFVRLLNEIMK